MSARNTRAAKAARRKDRARREANSHNVRDADSLVDVHSYDELVSLAERGDRLPCGCDAHELLHKMLASD